MQPDPSPALDPLDQPTPEEPRSLRRLGRRTPLTSQEPSSAPTYDASTVTGRLRIFAAQMGEQAQGSAMGTLFRMVVPRLLADMDGITDEQLGRMLDVLAERLDFVRYGEQAQEPRQDDEAPAQADAMDHPATSDPVTTEG